MAQRNLAFDLPDILAALDGTCASTSWTDKAKAELHLLGMNLHNMAVEFQCRRHPAEAAILEGYAIRIDELMKRAPEAVT